MILCFFLNINFKDDLSFLAVQLERLATIFALLIVVDTETVARDKRFAVDCFHVDPNPHANV